MKNKPSKFLISLILSLFILGLILFTYKIIYHQTSSYVFNKENIEYHQANPFDIVFYNTAYKFQKNKIYFDENDIIGGVIPHHLLAADMIADFFSQFRDKKYDSIILIGPNHFSAGDADIITSKLNWQTPYGEIKCDQELLSKLLKIKNIQVEENIFLKEHAINSEVAFIKKTFPDAKFLPLVLRNSVTKEQSVILAEKLFEISKNKNILVLTSVDFSHNTNNETARKNDNKSIKALKNKSFEKIYSLHVDSPASIYTLLKYSQLKQANFSLLKNSNAALLTDQLDLQGITSYVTGYFVKNLKEDINLLFFGDMMLDRSVGKLIQKNGLSYIFSEIPDDFFNNYNLISANLEGTVTKNGDHYSPQKKYDFAFTPSLVKELKKYNFTFFNLANNHFADQGIVGMKETRENLDKLNYNYSGCQNGKVGECSSRIIDVGDEKFGMIGLSSVYGDLDMDSIAKIIQDLEKKVDLIVVNIHWGNEYEHNFSKKQQKLAHNLIDFGADIIIGHHPHVIEGMEIYKNKAIFYSLGNFIFDQYFSKKTQEGLAVKINKRGEELNFELIPFKSKYSQISLLKDKEKQGFLKRFVKYSKLEKNDLENILTGELNLN